MIDKNLMLSQKKLLPHSTAINQPDGQNQIVFYVFRKLIVKCDLKRRKLKLYHWTFQSIYSV